MKNCRNILNLKIIKSKVHSDARGSLFPVNNSQIPFSVRRSFTVYDVPEGETRGYHAHHNTEQILSCLRGSLEITLKDLSGQEITTVLKKGDSLHQYPYEWAEITFGLDSILHTVCSTDYDESDYIRSFNEFLSYKD